MVFPFTLKEAAFAAVIALAVTWIIKTVSNMFMSLVGNPTEFVFHPKNVETVLKRCYALFPNQCLTFNGEDISRGMIVRVITQQKKTIEGKFIGSNNENMVCLMTDRSVIAQELNNIENIHMIKG